MKSSTVINKNSYKVNPDLYTSDYYLSDGYAGALQYKSGLHQLAPSVEYVYDRIPPGNGKQKLLDAGCGKGELMYFVSRKRYMPFGVDYSATAVRMASALMKAKGIDSAVVRKEDVRHLSFRSSFFDIVVSTDVLEHLDDNRAGLAFIDEAYRVLKPGGRLIIHTAPNHDHV
jgi:2-polyprenyl-3-methyl-5-hydroxy-6-metoxy-1,4-benzoquinol methylase